MGKKTKKVDSDKKKKKKKKESRKKKLQAGGTAETVANSANLDKIVAIFQTQGFYRVDRYQNALADLGPTQVALDYLGTQLQMTGLFADFQAEFTRLQQLPGGENLTAAINTAMASTDGLRILAIELNPRSHVATFGCGFDFSSDVVDYNGLKLSAFGLEVRHQPEKDQDASA